ncbi:hypothetical protein BC829DRAFT_434937 [Chytridium lagenaria]|nr:hypothetical protein BC829DRAFT_434937 [Chytridium lagenaria]
MEDDEGDKHSSQDKNTGSNDTRTKTLILHLGCGNSAMSWDMFKDGYEKQVNVDYSSSVIDHMAQKYADAAPYFSYGETFEEGEFDVAIDKGTLDAFLTGFPDEDPWSPSQAVITCAESYMTQVIRILKPGGLFIHITWAQPHFRRRFVEAVQGLDVTVKKVGTDWEYFVYIGRKGIRDRVKGKNRHEV